LIDGATRADLPRYISFPASAGHLLVIGGPSISLIDCGWMECIFENKWLISLGNEM